MTFSPIGRQESLVERTFLPTTGLSLRERVATTFLPTTVPKSPNGYSRGTGPVVGQKVLIDVGIINPLVGI